MSNSGAARARREIDCTSDLGDKSTNTPSLFFEGAVQGRLCAWVAQQTMRSPSLFGLLKDLGDDGWKLASDSDLTVMADKTITLDSDGLSEDIILKNPAYHMGILLQFWTDIRTAWINRSQSEFVSTLKPKAYFGYKRFEQADAAAFCILAAWELRAAGHGDLWRYILSTEESDMAMVFARTVDKTPKDLHSGQAQLRTFAQWFDSEDRLNETDHRILEEMDERTGFGSCALSVEGIENLSIMPTGIAYLRGKGSKIIADDYFIGIENMVNKTHLAHIEQDTQLCRVGHVAFRDVALARLIFPENTGSGK